MPAPPPTSILVVDDDECIRTVVETCLRRVGYDVAGACGRSDVLALLRSRQFHLVITDVSMPDLDGAEVLEELHIHQPRAAVLAMSGAYLNREFHRALVQLPGTGVVLMKPFHIEELMVAVDFSVKSHRSPDSTVAIPSGESTPGFVARRTRPRQRQLFLSGVLPHNSGLPGCLISDVTGSSLSSAEDGSQGLVASEDTCDQLTAGSHQSLPCDG